VFKLTDSVHLYVHKRVHSLSMFELGYFKSGAVCRDA